MNLKYNDKQLTSLKLNSGLLGHRLGQTDSGLYFFLIPEYGDNMVCPLLNVEGEVLPNGFSVSTDPKKEEPPMFIKRFSNANSETSIRYTLTPILGDRKSHLKFEYLSQSPVDGDNILSNTYIFESGYGSLFKVERISLGQEIITASLKIKTDNDGKPTQAYYNSVDGDEEAGRINYECLIPEEGTLDFFKKILDLGETLPPEKTIESIIMDAIKSQPHDFFKID